MDGPDVLPDLPGAPYLQVLERLHTALRPRNYLEIGTFDGTSLALARCASIAVDPGFPFSDPAIIARVVDKPQLLLYRMTSDAFFASHDPAALLGDRVQLAFLDGMHRCEFLLRDLINTERHCARNSVIALHDCLPVEEPMTDRTFLARPSLAPWRAWWWAGDVWRTARLLRRVRPDLSFTVLDAPPTGLVLITNLDPGSTVLADGYDAHVRTMLSWSLDEIGVRRHLADMDPQSTEAFATAEQLSTRFWLAPADDIPVREAAPPPAKHPVPAAPAFIGTDLDHLAHGIAPAMLEPLRSIVPTRTAAVVLSAKSEGCYLVEWVAHYRAVGFEHAFIYTNDSTDGSNLLLDALAKTGWVTVIRNEVGADVSPQIKAYQHSIGMLPALRDFEWVAYFDTDELLVPSEAHDFSVQETIAALKRAWTGPLPAAIYWNWQWYGSGGAVHRAGGLVQERFIYGSAHPMGKSLVRLATVDSMEAIHLPGPPGLLVVNAALEAVTVSRLFHIEPPALKHGRLHHYYHKSYEEFGTKRHRGRGGSPGGRIGKEVATFFEWEVPVWHETNAPMAPRLLARVHREVEALLADPAIASAVAQADAAHCALSSVLHPDGVEAGFLADRARYRLGA